MPAEQTIKRAHWACPPPHFAPFLCIVHSLAVDEEVGVQRGQVLPHAQVARHQPPLQEEDEHLRGCSRKVTTEPV